MRKSFKMLHLFFSLFICLASISAQPLAKDEGVQDVQFDKTVATLACPGVKLRIGVCDEDDRHINIHTIAKDVEKQDLNYYYLVPVGKIIGSGKDVTWDLTNTRPGNYSITIGIGKEGILKGNFITKNITVKHCDCDPGYECPSITISSPTAPADAGDTLIFTANVSGGSQDYVKYNWIVSEGKIVEGQGTSIILVKTTNEMKGHTITATVELGGIGAFCQHTISALAEVKDK